MNEIQEQRMKLKKATLSKIAEMICGNDPYLYFPYRSSSKLTRFFVDLDLDYLHDGSTRSTWVEGVLQRINEKPQKNESLPSEDMIKVIEALVDPDSFLFDETKSVEKARDAMDKALLSNGLKTAILQTGQAKLITIKGEFISTDKDSEAVPERVITFCPTVFKIPKNGLNEKLISVMMPFNLGFKGTYDSIKRVADYMKLECLRADDIWENSTFMQDIFDLIYTSKIVIVDYSGRNPNVMYETGIAHTLGKIVIPITQSLEDIPSDLGHHRALKYLPNEEGYRNLSNELYKRIKTIIEQ